MLFAAFNCKTHSDCLNGGRCIKGTCHCATGYDGANCGMNSFSLHGNFNREHNELAIKSDTLRCIYMLSSGCCPLICCQVGVVR